MKPKIEKFFFEGIHTGYTASIYIPKPLVAFGGSRKEAIKRLEAKVKKIKLDFAGDMK